MIAEVEGSIAIFDSSWKMTIMVVNKSQGQESRSGSRGGRRERKELAREQKLMPRASPGRHGSVYHYQQQKDLSPCLVSLILSLHTIVIFEHPRLFHGSLAHAETLSQLWTLPLLACGVTGATVDLEQA